MSQTKPQLYKLTDEHRAQLRPWAEKWIANALRTDAMSAEERDTARSAMRELYRAATLYPPPREVFCGGPITGAIVWGVATGVWWLREHPESHTNLFGRVLGEAELLAAIHRACALAVSRGMEALRGGDTAPAPTRAATDATRDATDVATCDATDVAIRDATDAATRTAIRDATDVATCDATDAATAAIRDATDAATRTAIRDATHGADRLTRFLVGCTARWHNGYNGGNMWSGWPAYLSFFRHVAQLPIHYAAWAPYETLATMPPRLVHERFWIVCDRPTTIGRDDRNSAHCDTGPQIAWRDGWKSYSVHGVRVPGYVVEHPDRLTVAIIDAERNAEVRRVMIDRYGRERWLTDAGAEKIHKDECGTLCRRSMPHGPPSVFVRVLNSTPESDGTRKPYYLRVPTEVTTAREAVAWTFGMRAGEYAPEVQT